MGASLDSEGIAVYRGIGILLCFCGLRCQTSHLLVGRGHAWLSGLFMENSFPGRVLQRFGSFFKLALSHDVQGGNPSCFWMALEMLGGFSLDLCCNHLGKL